MDNPLTPGKITVYLFSRQDGGREVGPRHMWGTREAILALENCVIREDTARQVPAGQVDGGFFFDIPESVSLKIDTPKSPD